MKMYELRLRFHKFGPNGPIDYIRALFQIMAWRRPDGKPLSEPMMAGLLTHICVTRPQWVNYSLLRINDTELDLGCIVYKCVSITEKSLRGIHPKSCVKFITASPVS